MAKPIIAIDIDDVLADNAAGFVAFSNQQWGTTLKPSDYDEHWAEVWGVSFEDTLKRRDIFLNSGAQRDYVRIDGAHDVLKHLAERFDLCIVTSRMTATKDDTLAWVHRHYEGIFTDEIIHFAGIWDNPDHKTIAKTKGDVVANLGASYLIDDQLKHCIAAAEQGIKGVLFGSYGWNQADYLPEGVVRCTDWATVKQYFDGQ